jgi:hypothetical protein
MDYPAPWEFFPMEDFTSASPRNPGELGVEVLAQVRPNGRILDHYRVTIGGSRILDINIGMQAILNTQPASTWRLKFQTWPADIELRRNMTTSSWKNLNEIVAANDGQITNAEGDPVPQDEAVEALKGSPAAYRFAIIVGEDERLQLQLQMMPASAATLMGKPAFRG